jgi:predicted nuclease of predicted toxin-antitoxin system
MEGQQHRSAEHLKRVVLLFDENLPPILKVHLADLFPGSKHVSDCNLARLPDSEVWDYAKAFGMTIVTKDRDFADRVRAEGSPPSIVQIRAGNASVNSVSALLRESAEKILVHAEYGGTLLELGLKVAQLQR